MIPIMMMLFFDSRRPPFNGFDTESDRKLMLGIVWGFLVAMVIIFTAVVYTGVQQGLIK